MATLSKRQIIIIGVAILVVLYGVYEYMSGSLAPKIKKTNGSNFSSQSVISGTAGTLMKDNFYNNDVYIISKAEADWGKDPFWERSSYREWVNKDKGDMKVAAATETEKIIYSGYIEAGNKRMAVINGLEYNVGDKLETGGYILKKITAEKIILSSKSEKTEKEIPIQE